MKFRMILTSLLFAVNAFASTYVGNGGNTSDIELQVSILQIKKTLAEIQSRGESDSSLCECDENLESHQLCENLKSLTPPQKKQCRDKLVSSAEALTQLLNEAQGVQIVWTLEAMQVSEKAGLREAEGVAVPNERKIFLNRQQFLNLKDYERIYLLTHELGHLIRFDQKFLKDEDVYGAFQQSDGGRQFLNALGSALAMKSFDTGAISDYQSALKRSKNTKLHWFSLNLGTEADRKDESSFAIKKYSGGSFRYRYQINHEIGVSTGLRYLKGSETFFGSANAKSELNLFDVAVNYRLMPFNNPLKFWGPAHFVFGIGAESGNAKMTIDDGLVSVTNEAKLFSPLVSAHFLLPIRVGLWLQTGAVLTMHSYEFEEIGFKSQKNQFYYEFGVSYGF